MRAETVIRANARRIDFLRLIDSIHSFSERARFRFAGSLLSLAGAKERQFYIFL
jgi:hypothetical protein